MKLQVAIALVLLKDVEEADVAHQMYLARGIGQELQPIQFLRRIAQPTVALQQQLAISQADDCNAS